MRKLQAKIIEEMGVQPWIDPAEEVRKRVTFLKEYLREQNFGKGITPVVVQQPQKVLNN